MRQKRTVPLGNSSFFTICLSLIFGRTSFSADNSGLWHLFRAFAFMIPTFEDLTNLLSRLKLKNCFLRFFEIFL